MLGQAADLQWGDWGTWDSLEAVRRWFVEQNVPFGQCIREMNARGGVWLHVSLGERRQLADYRDGVFRVFS